MKDSKENERVGRRIFKYPVEVYLGGDKHTSESLNIIFPIPLPVGLLLSLGYFLHGSCKYISLIFYQSSGLPKFCFNPSNIVAKTILKPVVFSEYCIFTFFVSSVPVQFYPTANVVFIYVFICFFFFHFCFFG